jgi:heptosyltransferase-2
MKIAVFLPNWLGDVAMATPVLRALRERFGQEAQIVGIMRPYLHETLDGTDWLDDRWNLQPNSVDYRERRFEVARRMRRTGFDLAVLLTNSISTAAIAWYGRAKRRIGYARYGRGPLLTDRITPPRHGRRVAEEPMVDYYLRIAERLGCTNLSQKLELVTTQQERWSAEAVWENLGLRTDGRVILFNSSGAYGGTKLWPVEHFAELARRVVRELNHDVLVMCGPNEREIARTIVKLSHCERVFSMADQPIGIGTAKACMQRGRLMVSTDSGPRHVAAALGKPVISMYGPMMPVWSENPTQRAIHLYEPLDCIGCHKRVCPLGTLQCMKDLSVDRVFDAILQLMSQEAMPARVA